jgi:hypothetical protein
MGQESWCVLNSYSMSHFCMTIGLSESAECSGLAGRKWEMHHPNVIYLFLKLDEESTKNINFEIPDPGWHFCSIFACLTWNGMLVWHEMTHKFFFQEEFLYFFDLCWTCHITSNAQKKLNFMFNLIKFLFFWKYRNVCEFRNIK